MEATLEFDRSVLAKLEEHNGLQNQTLDVTHRLMTSHNGDVFTFDILALAALKRSVALQSGFRAMILARNMICAGAILRLQLDTSLRMYGAWLVNDADDYAGRILRGERIQNIRDSAGQKLTDRYLVTALAKKYSWVPSLYEVSCDYVHFSKMHISAAFDGADRDTEVAHVKISHHDRELPQSHYFGALVDSMSCTKILNELIEARIAQRESCVS